MSSLADDVFVTPYISLSLSLFTRNPGGHPAHVENMHMHTPTYAHVLDAHTHTHNAHAHARTAAHFGMSVPKPGFC